VVARPGSKVGEGFVCEIAEIKFAADVAGTRIDKVSISWIAISAEI
jgi:hypothetical protein